MSWGYPPSSYLPDGPSVDGLSLFCRVGTAAATQPAKKTRVAVKLQTTWGCPSSSCYDLSRLPKVSVMNVVISIHNGPSPNSPEMNGGNFPNLEGIIGFAIVDMFYPFQHPAITMNQLDLYPVQHVFFGEMN